jgi:hypothetical protein
MDVSPQSLPSHIRKGGPPQVLPAWHGVLRVPHAALTLSFSARGIATCVLICFPKGHHQYLEDTC